MDNAVVNSYAGVNLRYICIALFLALGGITFGLDSGGMAGFLAMPAFQRDFGTSSPELKAYAISANTQLIFNLPPLAFAIICSLLSGEIGSRFGRRGGYIALGVLSGAGAAIQLGATTTNTIIAGKVVNGAVYGLGAAFVPMYISETAPTAVRGMLVSFLQLSINSGQLIASAINWGSWDLTSRWAYRGPFLAETLVPIIVLTGIWFVPESPRYLLTKGRRAEAATSFRPLRGPTYPEHAVQAEVDEITFAISEERRIASASVSWSSLFRGTNRRRTIICCLILVCQQYSGISFLTSYGTYYFVISGITDSWMVSFILNVMGVAGTLLSIVLLKYVGRRPIMLVGGAMQCLSVLTFAIVGVAVPGSLAAARVLAAFTLLYEFFYSASWGPPGFVLASEIASTELRAKTLALAIGVNWTCTLTLASWLPYALNPTIGNLGAKLGFVSGPCIAVGTIWMYFCLPETSGRSLEQLDELFVKGISARKSAGYQYTGEFIRNGAELADAKTSDDGGRVVKGDMATHVEEIGS